jgi:hypothetical protein
MATIDEITALLRGLSAEHLERVRAFVESLRRDARAAAWSFDFLQHFSEATHSGMEIQVADATCASVTRPALWEHPPMSGSANVGYLVPIPAGLCQVTLKFAIGIRDGAELPSDRFIAFRVLVNGWKLWSAVKNSRAWEEHEVKMPQLGSDIARIEFITDGLGDNRWNWAVWAEPRLEGE